MPSRPPLSRRTRLTTALAATLAGALLASAQEIHFDPPTPAATAPSVTEMPATTSAPATRTNVTTLPSAESVLQGLLAEKAAAPAATGPTSTTKPGGEPADPLRLREGQIIDGRSGHLVKNEADGEMQFVFDPPAAGQPAFPPMGLVPSRRLWAMEEAALGNNPAFRIDAEVTQYRGKNYLYIKPNGQPLPAATTPASRPTALVQHKDAVAPNEPVASYLREGQSVYSRVGRLSKDDKTGAMIFTFDGDGKQMYDPPMAIVPCRYLAVMEDASNNGTKPTKFRISAEVTQYRGKNYLYIKFVQAVRDLSQF